MTPLAIWEEYIAMDKQDMRDYMPYLREIASGDVLEIGVCAGVSTSAFLLGMDDKNDGYLCSIDIDASCADVLQPFPPRWTFICGDSQTMPFPSWMPEEVDTLLVDGDHHYDAALSDLRRFSPLVKNGGTILMHDVLPSEYGRSVCPEIDECRQAWDSFCAEGNWPNHIMPGLFGMGVMRKVA